MDVEYTLAVVIPCWNEEHFLPDMLDCLIKQTFKDWRAFCVDDISTDSTANIIKSYHTKDKRIQYICRNRGPKGGQTCRNIGMDLAHEAKYVMFFDADDLVAPYCFEQRVKYMENNINIDFAVFPVIAFSDNIYEESGPVFGVKTFCDDLQAMLNFNLAFHNASNIYKVDSIISVGLNYDESIKSHQDVLFNIQVLLHKLKYEFAYESIARADYFYRVDQFGVASKIKSISHFDSHIHFIDKVTRLTSNIYGKKYDFYLEAMIVNFLSRFKKSWNPYFKLLNISWMKSNYVFKYKIILYLIIFKVDRRFIFMKYRKYSKRQNTIWQESMNEIRKNLLNRGFYL